METLETKEMILRDSPEAASYRENLCGWVSAKGRYWGNGPEGERMARFEGCTHVSCGDCGEPTSKQWTHCDECRERRRHERWLKRPVGEWSEEGPVYSEVIDEYLYSIEEVEDAAEEHGNLDLVICDPIKLAHIDEDYWGSDLETEDGLMDLPDEVKDAMDKLNAALDSMSPVTWTPGRYRVPNKEAK